MCLYAWRVCVHVCVLAYICACYNTHVFIKIITFLSGCQTDVVSLRPWLGSNVTRPQHVQVPRCQAFVVCCTSVLPSQSERLSYFLQQMCTKTPCIRTLYYGTTPLYIRFKHAYFIGLYVIFNSNFDTE